jgi:biopolymer transport protein ExbB/TolQ
MDSSIWDLMQTGGYAMWLVIAFSVIAIGVAIERGIAQWQFTTRAKQLADTVNRCLNRGAVDEGRSACERSQSPLADVFLVGFNRIGSNKPEHVTSAVHRERLRVIQELRTRQWIMATIGATAPFVGLFGTVVGMMSAMSKFKGIAEVTFSMVAGPLSEALVVTAAGILVAVEAVILFNFFNQRVGRIGTEMKLLTDEFLELLLDGPAEVAPTTARAKDRRDDRNTKDDDGGREAA